MIRKPKIAIIGVVVVGIPLLDQILSRLVTHYDLTVYSFMRADPEAIPKGVRFRSTPNRLHQRLKYLLLSLYFVADHWQRPFQLLHAQSAFPGGVLARRLARLFGLNWMVTLIGGETECYKHLPFGYLRDHALKSITKKVCDEAGLLTVMSSFQAQSVKRNLLINRDIVVLPYAPTVRPLARKQLSSPLRLLHIAYHHPVKNHSMLLRCLNTLQETIDVHLTIVGANYGEAFSREIQALDLERQICMAGIIKYKHLDSYFDKAHVLIHTSWYEGLPAVAIEAMAHGIPVCGTKVGIIADFADSFTIAVDVDDHIALSSAIIKLSQDPYRYEQTRQDAYNWVKNNDQSFFVKQTIQQYTLLSENPRK